MKPAAERLTGYKVGGISPRFVEYLKSFPGFVSEDAPAISHDDAMGMWMKTDG